MKVAMGTSAVFPSIPLQLNQIKFDRVHIFIELSTISSYDFVLLF